LDAGNLAMGDITSLDAGILGRIIFLFPAAG
jgi:hypothetical protein